MEISTDEFLHRCAVTHYTNLLRVTRDEGRRRDLLQWLAEANRVARARGWSPLTGYALAVTFVRDDGDPQPPPRWTAPFGGAAMSPGTTLQ